MNNIKKAAPVCETETAKAGTTIDYTTDLRGLPSGFICDNCGNWFEDVVQQTERHDHSGWPEYSLVSPCCHYSYEVAYECQKCGATIPESQSAYGLCSDCERKATWRFKWYMANEFDERERLFLDDLLEGHSLTELDKIVYVPAT